MYQRFWRVNPCYNDAVAGAVFQVKTERFYEYLIVQLLWYIGGEPLVLMIFYSSLFPVVSVWGMQKA